MKLAQFLKRHSSTILTCVGAAGVAITAVMAVKATPKAIRLLEEAEKEKGEALTKIEVVKTTAPVYIPSAVMGVLTISCIFGANMLNKRQQAALTSAYAVINRAYSNYRNKVCELYGEETHENILASIAAEKAKNVPIYSSTFTSNCCLDFDDPTEEEKLFYDVFGERYFQSTFSRVLQAEYHLNRNFVLGATVSLNDFYEFLGIEKTDYGDTVGWDIFGGLCWVDFDHRKTVMDDGLECYIIDMAFEPYPDFDKC